MKSIGQGAIAIVMFFAVWGALSQVDWLAALEVKKTKQSTEEQLGKLLWENIRAGRDEIADSLVVSVLDTIVSKICRDNNLPRDFIKIHVLIKDEVNAFALPHGRIVIYSGLINASENPEELAGVISHELAHIQLNHVMKKLIKEIGLSMIISMTTGSAGGEVLKETAKVLSSSAFDRTMEKEADIQAVDYLVNAGIDPGPFSNFLYRLSFRENEALSYLSWLNTHPDSRERAAYLVKYHEGNSTAYKEVVSRELWEKSHETVRHARESGALGYK